MPSVRNIRKGGCSGLGKAERSYDAVIIGGRAWAGRSLLPARSRHYRCGRFGAELPGQRRYGRNTAIVRSNYLTGGVQSTMRSGCFRIFPQTWISICSTPSEDTSPWLTRMHAPHDVVALRSASISGGEVGRIRQGGKFVSNSTSAVETLLIVGRSAPARCHCPARTPSLGATAGRQTSAASIHQRTAVTGFVKSGEVVGVETNRGLVRPARCCQRRIYPAYH
jgi:hypothetical protein